MLLRRMFRKYLIAIAPSSLDYQRYLSATALPLPTKNNRFPVASSLKSNFDVGRGPKDANVI